jgi:hypothetical protein
VTSPHWIYAVGVPDWLVRASLRVGGQATHRVTNGPRGVQLPRANKYEITATPRLFAMWLVALAAMARTSGKSPPISYDA